jgi:polar amino acid transport system substrate-binding protein
LDIALVNEMTRVWAEQNGTPIRIEYVYTGYDGLYDALKTGQFDAILSALPYDPRKTQDVAFSHSYFNGGPLIVVRADDAGAKSWFDVAGKRIGVELGSSGDSFARRWQRPLRYDVRESNTPAEVLRALRSGGVDAAFVEPIAYLDFLKSDGGVKATGDPLSNDLIVLAVRRDTPSLGAQINAVIDAMKADGRMDQLYAQWF